MDKQLIADHERFRNITFSEFKAMANNSTLSLHEKIGFPDSFRKDKEQVIMGDILNKLTNLQKEKQMVVDIGAGCGQLALELIDYCKVKKHSLFLIDSKDMLDQLPDASFIKKIPAFYPSDCKDFILNHVNQFDVILSYSVLHYIFVEANLHEFLDESLSLLTHGGQFLLGDIPNVSKRKRFLSSPNGIKHHQEFYNPNELPQVKHMAIEPQQIDDAVIMGLLMRCRYSGFDAYIVPQSSNLPMSNRREDLLIIKP